MKIGHLARILNKAYKNSRSNGGWRAVAAQYGISPGMAYRIARQGYEPSDPRIRLQLGLPVMVEVQVCKHCGKVHVKKTCPNKNLQRTLNQPISEWSPGRLRWALENREKI